MAAGVRLQGEVGQGDPNHQGSQAEDVPRGEMLWVEA